MANETGTNNSALTNLVSNFDEADTDGDGKVSAKEAMAYNQSTRAGGATGNASSEEQVMMNIMQLVRAYGGPGEDSSQSSSTGTLSVSA